MRRRLSAFCLCDHFLLFLSVREGLAKSSPVPHGPEGKEGPVGKEISHAWVRTFFLFYCKPHTIFARCWSGHITNRFYQPSVRSVRRKCHPQALDKFAASSVLPVHSSFCFHIKPDVFTITTVEPLLSGPLLNVKVPEFASLNYCKLNLYLTVTSIKRTRSPFRFPNLLISLYFTSIERSLTQRWPGISSLHCSVRDTACFARAGMSAQGPNGLTDLLHELKLRISKSQTTVAGFFFRWSWKRYSPIATHYNLNTSSSTSGRAHSRSAETVS